MTDLEDLHNDDHRCACRCHDFLDAEGRFIAQAAVLRIDEIEAVTACVLCQDWHTPALSGRPAELLKPEKREPHDPTECKWCRLGRE